jgi:hypothetical protein
MMSSGYAGEGRQDVSRARRPGELFEDGETYLIVRRHLPAQVVNEEQLSQIVRCETAFTTIHLNRIVGRVYQRLGIAWGDEEKSANA